MPNLFPGYNGLVSTKKMVIPVSRRLSYIRVVSSVQSKGFESLNRLLHTSSNDDDDFAELGLPVERGGCLIPKLMTEKPEPFLKTESKKKSHGSSFKADGCLNNRDISKKAGISSPVPTLDLENNNDGRSNFRTSSSITIKNVPSIINLLDLKEAISVFGNVSKASKRSVADGLDCCDIEFKSVKSSRKALSEGKITVKNFNLPICSLPSSEIVTIRISNVNSETADSAIHSRCILCGPLEGLVRTKEDVVNALFSVEGEADIKSILNKLNSTVMDESKWSAQLEHGESRSTEMTENGNAQDDFGLKISGHLAEVKREVVLKKIYAEDLENLHRLLFHLENDPLKANGIFPTSN
ncbi:hypothetical protein PTKIN_Ptkin12aG0142400 [Pterospermum kingtungense]